MATLPPAAPANPRDRLGHGRRELRGAFRGTRDRVEPGCKVAVVGGGIAGIAASLILAERGAQVTLFEREPFLGGRAGAPPERLGDGDTFRMERSFPAVARHYYNFRALYRRVDPELASLRPLGDPTVVDEDGAVEVLSGLPATPPLNVLALLRRTPFLSMSDLRKIDVATVRSLLTFDPQRNYAEHDAETAASFLDRLGLPPRARQMLVRVFCRADAHDETNLSAAELLSLLHFHFLGNPEGLALDVPDEPISDALFSPIERVFTQLGGRVLLGGGVQDVEHARGDKLVVTANAGTFECDGLVIALDVAGVQGLFSRSSHLRADAELARNIAALTTAPPFCVWRAFLDKGADPARPVYASVLGRPAALSVALHERIEGESRRWALRTGGSVVQMHAFGLAPEASPEVVRAELRAALDRLYPELRGAAVVHEGFARATDRAAFPPGSAASRPRVSTPYGNIAFAGDWVKLPFPAAHVERAAASGAMAANTLLDRWDVRGEPIWTIPPRGFVAAIASGRMPSRT